MLSNLAKAFLPKKVVDFWDWVEGPLRHYSDLKEKTAPSKERWGGLDGISVAILYGTDEKYLEESGRHEEIPFGQIPRGAFFVRCGGLYRKTADIPYRGSWGPHINALRIGPDSPCPIYFSPETDYGTPVTEVIIRIQGGK